jgi:hypothetical protein
MYGSEARTLGRTDERRLEAAKMRFLQYVAVIRHGTRKGVTT